MVTSALVVDPMSLMYIKIEYFLATLPFVELLLSTSSVEETAFL